MCALPQITFYEQIKMLARSAYTTGGFLILASVSSAAALFNEVGTERRESAPKNDFHSAAHEQPHHRRRSRDAPGLSAGATMQRVSIGSCAVWVIAHAFAAVLL